MQYYKHIPMHLHMAQEIRVSFQDQSIVIILPEIVAPIEFGVEYSCCQRASIDINTDAAAAAAAADDDAVAEGYNLLIA